MTLGDMFHMTSLTLWHFVICSIWHHWHCGTWWNVHMIGHLVICSIWYHWHNETRLYVPYNIIDIMTIGDMFHMMSRVISYFLYDILWYYTFMWNSLFWLTEKHLIKFRLSILSAKPWNKALAHNSSWHWSILLDNRWNSKKYSLHNIYACTVQCRFWLSSS